MTNLQAFHVVIIIPTRCPISMYKKPKAHRFSRLSTLKTKQNSEVIVSREKTKRSYRLFRSQVMKVVERECMPALLYEYLSPRRRESSKKAINHQDRFSRFQ